MAEKAEVKNVKATPDTAEVVKMGRIKLGFLYVVIGGLVISALISVVAILVGEFNEVVRRALGTTFIFVTHSLLILAIVSADRDNQIGRKIVPTTILATIILNVLTSTLGIWGIWDGEYSWRALLAYALLIGSAFMVTGSLRLIIAHQMTKILTYATVTLILATTALLLPWVLLDSSSFTDLYFRLVSAFSILAVTSLVILVIIRRIALSSHPALKASIPAKTSTPNGMMAILVTIGTLVAIFWLYGFFAFVGQAAERQYDNTVSPSDDYSSDSYTRPHRY